MNLTNVLYRVIWIYGALPNIHTEPIDEYVFLKFNTLLFWLPT
jgi:hypothetical protein